MPGGRASGWIALALVIALWQLAGSAGWVNPLFLPAPSAIAVAIYKLAMSGALWQHVSASVVRIGSGWVLGTVPASSSALRSDCRRWRAASASPSSRRCFRFRKSRCCRC
jgi:ABC-type nitrate/sulfonate/bicarbonate transport system permease component